MKGGRHVRIFPVMLFALMALLTLWLDQVSKLGSFGRDLDPSRPEYVSDKINTTRFDTQGRIQQRLQANSLWQYPKQNDVYFSDGVITLYQAGTPDYTFSAGTGHYNTRTQMAYFEQKAHIQKPAMEGKPAMTLDSSNITVDTVRRYASSAMPTVMHYGNNIAHTIGFNYDYRTGTVNLLTAAKVIYAQ